MTKPRISFEFFPPQSIDASFRLWDAVHDLSALRPDFVSVTYGAGGAMRDKTLETAAAIQQNLGLRVMAHLTCAGASTSETLAAADSFADAGITEVLALRGDMPQAGRFQPHPDGFASSEALVAALAQRGRFKIRVAAYPEPHPDAADDRADVTWLKRKLDAGASSAITQFFFDADAFFRFRDRCAAAGINAPIIPGILPIQSWEGAKRFAARCGARVPVKLDATFQTAIRDGREGLLALTQAVTLCDRLITGGVEDLHFYTLNRPQLVREVVRALGIQPQTVLEKVA